MKCVFRYFHKVPADAPQLELKASYGLADPITFELPPLSDLCTPEVYVTFDLTKGAKDEKVRGVQRSETGQCSPSGPGPCEMIFQQEGWIQLVNLGFTRG